MRRQTAEAKPSKRFFVEMLTRDISVSECILDLADNSIDSLIAATLLDVTDRLVRKPADATQVDADVDIEFDGSYFQISDTCGGIGLKRAREEVFLFGNPELDGPGPGLSVYGIGMKRAFFKLGRRVSVRSRDGRDMFEMEIDVVDWLSRPDDWTFAFNAARDDKSEPPGTTVRVTSLNDGVARQLGLESFRQTLLNRIGSTYALFIEAGLRMSLNKAPAESRYVAVAQSAKLRPAVSRLTHEAVDIVIVVGITPTSDREPRGWYVFCNGRMVVEASRDRTTGWGDGMVRFAGKYNHFIGYVYFTSDDPRLLPWTTTKEGVEVEAPVYQRALGQMRVAAKPVLRFLSAAYKSESQATGRKEIKVLKAAQGSAPQALDLDVTQAFLADVSDYEDEPQVRIVYDRPLSDVVLVKEALANTEMPDQEVGERTFDYFFKRVVIDG